VILLIDTSTEICKTVIIDGNDQSPDEWLAGRGLADGLIGYVRRRLNQNGMAWNDITGIGVFKGPGSFTGLRIGLTVMNTFADDAGIPIVGETGDEWKEKCLARLNEGENDGLVMPLYGREATITKPRK
jgi:tRNA threonylcarbamoyladenosine biosynthesis protein TsaB